MHWFYRWSAPEISAPASVTKKAILVVSSMSGQIHREETRTYGQTCWSWSAARADLTWGTMDWIKKIQRQNESKYYPQQTQLLPCCFPSFQLRSPEMWACLYTPKNRNSKKTMISKQGNLGLPHFQTSNDMGFWLQIGSAMAKNWPTVS